MGILGFFGELKPLITGFKFPNFTFFINFLRYNRAIKCFWGIKKALKIKACCGELGIRTPGPVTVNSFQDCRNRPLCQLSGAKIRFGEFK
jgi:hypothetical protein